jgi:transketolase
VEKKKRTRLDIINSISGGGLVYSLQNVDVEGLNKKAQIIREHIITMIHKASMGHPGGSLSAVEIITALYFHIMNIDPSNPTWAERDRFVLSKGHACPALYAALAEKGFFPVDDLVTLRKSGSHLQGHPDMRKTPGIDISTGSLGNGFACALGMAIAGKASKKNYTVYALLGDGELQEGIVWEAAMAASHHNLNNLVVIIDYNGLQITGWVNCVNRIEPLVKKWEAFGWQALEIEGNDMASILSGFQKARKMSKPVVIIAHTTKGKGVSFMENIADWHGKAPNEEQMVKALEEIRKGCGA